MPEKKIQIPKNDSPSKPGKKSGPSPFAVVFAVLIIAAVVCVGGNFFGPYKGWFDKLSKRPAELKKPVLALPKAIDPETVKVPDKTPPPPPKPVEVEKKSEYEILYDKILAKYLKRFKTPKLGKTYQVNLKNNSVVKGVLDSFSDGKISLKEKYGVITYPINSVSPKSYPALFPKRAAKILAMKEIEKIIRDKKAKEVAAAVKLAAKTGRPLPKAIRDLPLKYNPKSVPTPDELKGVLKDFAFWLSAQQSRVGGKIATKIFAKRQGENIVMYLKVSPVYWGQDYDVRFTIAEAIWKMWSVKCLNHNIANLPGQCHVVMLRGKLQVGGSTVKDAAAVWMRR